MSFIVILSLALAMAVFTSTPGPGVFATVAKSLSSGFRSSFGLIIGIVLGDFVFLLFAILGLSFIAQQMGELFIIVKIFGGIYLFVIGFKIFISNSELSKTQNNKNGKSKIGDIISGLFISLSNPKVIIFYCSFLPTFIDLSNISFFDTFILSTVIVTVLSSVLLGYAYTASRARKIFSSQKSNKILNRTAGGVMMASGLVLASKS